MTTTARTDTDSIISTHPYRSGPLGHDGQPRCSDCLAKSDHPAHVAFANAGPFATEDRLAEARTIADEAVIWDTDTREIKTPRGVRYVGRSIARGRGPIAERIRYSSPIRIHENQAWELARSRTIHHNVWHDGTEEAARIAHLHHRGDCHERS